MIKLAPSILSADFANLGADIQSIEAASDMLHIDIMDGHFVPNISIGVPIVKSIRAVTKMPFDVHLMLEHPISMIGVFAKAGVDMITFHIESKDDPLECVRLIRENGCHPGVALNPDTSPSQLTALIGKVEMVLQMTVFPGFGGQPIVAEALNNLPELRRMFGETDIQVDGGITAENASDVRDKGANVFVMGNTIFKEAAADRLSTLRAIRVRLHL